jgi:hypothetical protein
MAPHRQPKKTTISTSSVFDETALSKLTEKINKNLDDTSNKKQQGKRKSQEAGAKELQPRKKRRSSGGEAPVKAQKQTSKQRANDPKEELLENIKELGGNASDLEFFDELDSDTEEAQLEQPRPDLDQSFAAELQKFASGLGFEGVRDETFGKNKASDGGDDLSEENDDEEADQVATDEDMGEAAEKVSTSRPEITPSKADERRPGHLVSKHLSLVTVPCQSRADTRDRYLNRARTGTLRNLEICPNPLLMTLETLRLLLANSKATLEIY